MKGDPFTDELFDLGTAVTRYTEAWERRHIGTPAGRAMLVYDCPSCHY